MGVSFVVQLMGAAIALGLAVLSGEPPPDARTIALGSAAGAVGVLGITGLYHGLAVGRMGVVAPVTGVIAASLPVVAGLALAGLPGPEVVLGIGLALVAVVLVSRVGDAGAGRSGIEFGLLAGLGIGAFNILVGLLPEGRVFWPLVGVKVASAIVLVLLVTGGRRPWRVPSTALPAVLAVGAFDMAGNVLYVLASQAGRLDVAATLASLYPVTTIVLAVALLGERVGRSHAAGIAAAAAAVVLIAAGSA